MLSSTDFCSLTSPSSSCFPSILLDSDPTFSHGCQAPDPFIPNPGPPGPIVPNIDPCFCFRQSGSNPIIPIKYASCQDPRVPVLLNTRKWSPSPSFVGPRMIPEPTFLPMEMGFSTSHSHFDAIFPSDRAIGHDIPHVNLGTQFVPNSSPEFLCAVGNGDATFSTNLDHANLLASNSLAQFPTSSTTEHVTCSVGDERKSPLAIYRSPDRKGSGRQRSRRARAVNIDGVWIDEDDLFSSAGEGFITVHECQWNKSSGPCGMWIVGSRTQVGAHIRKWHKQSHTNSRIRCLWDGCTKATMLKDSINRHVVTVHLGERYHCRGCDQVFLRQDVYDEHVENDSDEACRDVGAVMVYGTACRMIDTSQMLRQEFVMQADKSM